MKIGTINLMIKYSVVAILIHNLHTNDLTHDYYIQYPICTQCNYKIKTSIANAMKNLCYN